MSSKVIPLLQAFSSAICRICGVSRGPSAHAELLVLFCQWCGGKGHPASFAAAQRCYTFYSWIIDAPQIRSCLIYNKSSPKSFGKSRVAKSPLVTMGRPQIHPQIVPSSLTITTPSNTPIPRSTPLTIPTASGSTYPFCHNTLCGQTDRPTDGPRRIYSHTYASHDRERRGCNWFYSLNCIRLYALIPYCILGLIVKFAYLSLTFCECVTE